MRDAGSRLELIRNGARVLHYYQADGQVDPGHFKMRPGADAA
jgi:hypothetical protein